MISSDGFSFRNSAATSRLSGVSDMAIPSNFFIVLKMSLFFDLGQAYTLRYFKLGIFDIAVISIRLSDFKDKKRRFLSILISGRDVSSSINVRSRKLSAGSLLTPSNTAGLVPTSVRCSHCSMLPTNSGSSILSQLVSVSPFRGIFTITSIDVTSSGIVILKFSILTKLASDLKFLVCRVLLQYNTLRDLDFFS